MCLSKEPEASLCLSAILCSHLFLDNVREQYSPRLQRSLKGVHHRNAATEKSEASERDGGNGRGFMNEPTPASLLFIPIPWHVLQVPPASRLFSMSTHLTSPNPPTLWPWGNGRRGCSPAVPLHSPQWPFSGPLLYPSSAFLLPFIPPLSPWPYRPHLTLQHPSTPLLGR